jgi:ABC-type nitrate/sulfonate/bicarbonate transport system substrate-binding protein
MQTAMPGEVQMSSFAVLRLIQFRAGYNLPVHVAVERGHFARYGLQVDVTYTPGSLPLLEGLKAGQFEIGYAAADDLVAEVEGPRGRGVPEPDLFLFMGLYSGLISLVGAPQTRDIHALRGQSLAVDATTSGFVFVLHKTLQARGLALEDYHLVALGGWESRFHALVAGQCAATLLTPPYVGEALAAGCHLLARAEEMIPVYQATCGIARRSWARENADLLVRYIRAYVEATRWCFDPQHRQACLGLLMRHHGITPAPAAQTLAALLETTNGLSPTAELNLPGITVVLELRAERGALSRPVPPPEHYVDLSYYRRAVGVEQTRRR